MPFEKDWQPKCKHILMLQTGSYKVKHTSKEVVSSFNIHSSNKLDTAANYVLAHETKLH